jgi:regulator of sigma E protease
MSVIIFLIILAILILVHEFGHFIVAKKSGIRVDEFGLGFPPKLYAKKYGETTYTLNAIPFGGFVKIFGEDPHLESIREEDKSRSFYYKSKWIQAAVLVAGVTMNLIFAWLLISLGYVIGLPSSKDYVGYGKVENIHLVVTDVLENSPAQKAGLSSGDVLTFVSSGQKSLTGDNLTPEKAQNVISNAPTDSVEIKYTRGKGKEVTIFVKPEVNKDVGRKIIGISMDEIGTLKIPLRLALISGFKTTIDLIKNTAEGIYHFLWDSVRFKSDLSQVSGPIGIANVVGQARALGFIYLLSVTALISINLAIINLLPLPALDGGRLLFVVIEAIIRRPISPKVVRWTNYVGFALLMILMVVVTTHDLLKLL